MIEILTINIADQYFAECTLLVRYKGGYADVARIDDKGELELL